MTGYWECNLYSTVQYSTLDTQQWAPRHRGKTNKVYQILQFFTQLLVRNPSCCEIYLFGIKTIKFCGHPISAVSGCERFLDCEARQAWLGLRLVMQPLNVTRLGRQQRK